MDHHHPQFCSQRRSTLLRHGRLVDTFKYDYLIHSILALAASHLNAVSNANAGEEAISHRILAVKSLNEALSVPPRSQDERDARMAAAMALTFQSSHLQDGLLEFLTMVRGCNLIAEDELLGQPDSAFYVRLFLARPHQYWLTRAQAFREDGHLETMRNRLTASQLNSVNSEDLDNMASSLDQLDYLAMADFEIYFLSLLKNVVAQAYNDPIATYTAFVVLYNAPSRWTHDDFQMFINPNNVVAQILLAHFIAIQAILTPILVLERVGFQGIDAPTAVLGWIEGIYVNVPLSLRHHVEFCRTVSRYPFVRFMGERQIDPSFF